MNGMHNHPAVPLLRVYTKHAVSIFNFSLSAITLDCLHCRSDSDKNEKGSGCKVGWVVEGQLKGLQMDQRIKSSKMDLRA